MYTECMFIRKKKNISGSVSVQIVSKTNGYKVVKTVGCSSNKNKVEELKEEAENLIATKFGTQRSMDFGHTKTDSTILKCESVHYLCKTAPKKTPKNVDKTL